MNIFFWLNVIVGAQSWTGMVRTDSMEQVERILEHSDPTTLVIFDVDHVLMRPKDLFFHPRWNKHPAVQACIHALTRHARSWERQVNTMVLQAEETWVDQRILSILGQLRQRGIPTIALTKSAAGEVGHSGTLLIDLYQAKLGALGISFTNLSPFQQELIFTELPNRRSRGQPKMRGGHPMMRHGMIFTGRNDKGLVLGLALRRLDYTPKRIIMIDDRWRNLKAVQDYCEQQGIAFQGIHFTAVERQKNVPPVDLRHVRHQLYVLAHYNRWLSDEETQRAIRPF